MSGFCLSVCLFIRVRGCILFWIVRKKKTPRKMKTPVLSKTEKKSIRVCRGVESSQKLNES